MKTFISGLGLTLNHILGAPIAAVRSKFDVSGDEYFKKHFWC
jgi:hypothetical protein